MSTLTARSARWNPTADPTAVAGFLRDLGYLPPGTPDTIETTPATGEDRTPADWVGALRLFQAIAGLEVDGVAGPHTVHALAKAHHAWLEARTFAA